MQLLKLVRVIQCHVFINCFGTKFTEKSMAVIAMKPGALDFCIKDAVKLTYEHLQEVGRREMINGIPSNHEFTDPPLCMLHVDLDCS